MLTYRGMSIKDLCGRDDISFIDVAIHLINRDFENVEFQKNCILGSERIINDSDINLINFIKTLPKNNHPMQKLQTILPVLKSFYASGNIDGKVNMNSSILYLAKMPLIVATLFRIEKSRDSIKESISEEIKDLNSYEEIFMHLMFGGSLLSKLSEEKYKKNLSLIRKLLIIHADHGQNASTTTARVVASSGANMSACLSAAVGTLSGSAHGGANQAVMEMLESIGDEKNIPSFLEQVKNKQQRLMGFGHRVYKNMDPRASIIKQEAESILKDNKLFKIGKALEVAALSDDYFKSRKLYPNVDFYSGLIYQELGIPKNMFTVMFAASRVSGWMANVIEQQTGGKEYATPIIRPKQIYVQTDEY